MPECFIYAALFDIVFAHIVCRKVIVGLYVVYEHSLAGNDTAALAAAELGFELASRKKYGDTTVDVLRACERSAS